MPLYEYYCPDNHTVYQFYAKTLAQGRTIPRCPDDPKYRMERMISTFAIASGGKSEPESAAGPEAADASGDARMEVAMGAMEKEFSSVDENDPKAMARMMRKMSELTGETIDGEMEEVVRKLEEGADPESLEATGPRGRSRRAARRRNGRRPGARADGEGVAPPVSRPATDAAPGSEVVRLRVSGRPAVPRLEIHVFNLR
jgi:hypothetical protein